MQLYLRTLKFEFHLTFRCHEIVFFLFIFFSQPFKKVKTILSLQVVQSSYYTVNNNKRRKARKKARKQERGQAMACGLWLIRDPDMVAPTPRVKPISSILMLRQ